MMGELTASIAHEINQPLAAIVTLANACTRMLAGPSPDLNKIGEGVKNIAEAGTTASEMISRIRAFLSRDVAEKTHVDINELIREALLLLTPGELHNHQISVRTELLPGLPSVLADRIRLTQVILNLITNGIEAMAAIADRPRVLLIRSQGHEPGSVLVAIKDSGMGIDPGDTDRIFAPFFTTKPNGLGMGLSISRSIVEAHGGRLWATPNDDQGTTFRFTLLASSD
jgi:C4-dicarboxylate-specific signal transduction histidine kinase